jgi:hypothetical protein
VQVARVIARHDAYAFTLEQELDDRQDRWVVVEDENRGAGRGAAEREPVGEIEQRAELVVLIDRCDSAGRHRRRIGRRALVGERDDRDVRRCRQLANLRDVRGGQHEHMRCQLPKRCRAQVAGSRGRQLVAAECCFRPEPPRVGRRDVHEHHTPP